MTLLTADTTKPKQHYFEILSPWIGKQIRFRGKKDFGGRFKIGTIRSLDGDFVEGYSPTASAFGSQEQWLYAWYEFEAGVPE